MSTAPLLDLGILSAFRVWGVFPAAVVATGKRSRRYKAQFWFPARGPRKRKTILIPVKLGKPLAV